MGPRRQTYLLRATDSHVNRSAQKSRGLGRTARAEFGWSRSPPLSRFPHAAHIYCVVLLCHHGCGSRSPASGAHVAEASVALTALHYELAVALHITFLRFSGFPLCHTLLEMAAKSGYTRQCPLDIRCLRGGRWSPGCLRQRRTHHRPVPRAAAWDGASGGEYLLL